MNKYGIIDGYSNTILSLINRSSRKIISKNIGDFYGIIKLDLMFMNRTLHQLIKNTHPLQGFMNHFFND